MARAVYDIAANAGRIPPCRIWPERRHQAGRITRVERDGGIGRLAMLVQPHLEPGDQLRLGRRCCHVSGLAHADLDQVPAKELDAENCVVVATASPGARTATGSQVLAEHRQINVAQACALIGHDMAKMSSRRQISHGRARVVALPFERYGEVVEVRSARPAPQMPQHLRC